ncbi:MAG: hypothetical protein AB9915_00105 [Candidatus Dojkabacteria bacterium]
MNIEQLGPVELPKLDKLEVATRLYPELNTMEDGKILLEEMKINGELNPDVTKIDASVDTHVQIYEGDGKITEVFYSTKDNKPVGLILMSPEGEISLKSYNPLTDGGPRGFSIEKGWSMQFIIPEGTVLTFYEYWYPKGYCVKTEDGKSYGETMEKDVTDEAVLKKFKEARLELLASLKAISNN